MITNRPGVIYHFDQEYALTRPEFEGIVLYQIGEMYAEGGFEVEEHMQWCYEITYIEAGSGIAYTNAKSYEVHANDVILHGRYCRHNMRADPNTRIRFLYLGFDVPETSPLYESMQKILEFFDKTDTPCRMDRFGVGELLRRMLQEFYCEYEGFRQSVAAYMRLLVWNAYRNGHLKGGPTTLESDSDAAVGSTVYRIMRYVDEHLCEIDSIRTVASALNYNYSYLSFIFKKKTGMTLQRYIVNKKMDKALQLLGDRRMSVSQAANALGFKSTQSFSKVFSSTFGMNPSTYIKQKTKEEPK